MKAKHNPYLRVKRFIKGLLVLVAMACVAPFFLKDAHHRPLLEPADIKLPAIDAPNLKPLLGDDVVTGRSGTSKPMVTIYRWRDEHGVWHFADHNKPDGSAEIIYQGVDDPENNETGAAAAASTRRPSTMESDPAALEEDELDFDLPLIPLSIPPSKAKALKKEAQRLKESIDQRTRELGDLLDDAS